MRVRTLAATALACLLGACTEAADPMSVFSPEGEGPPVSLARKRTYGMVRATPDIATISVGDTVRIAARTRVRNDQAIAPKLIVYRSQDTSVASVDASGLITAVRTGATRIDVIGDGSGVTWKPDFVDVTVTTGPTSVSSTESESEEGVSDVPAGSELSAAAVPTQTSETSAASSTTESSTSGGSTESATAGSSTSTTSAGETTTTTTTATSTTSTSTTTTTAPQPLPPAPVLPLPPGSHEPSGYTPLNDRAFYTKVQKSGQYPTSAELTYGEGWSGTEAYYSNFSIARDASAPSGDGTVGQMYFPANMTAGTGPATATFYLPDGATQVYISVWMKLSSNWVGNEASINKMFFFGVSGGNNQFVFIAYGSGSNPLVPVLALQGVEDNNTRSSHFRPNVNSGARVNRGQWQRYEFVLKCNSAPGAADGTMDMWVDGALTTSVQSVNFTQKAHPTRPCDMNVFNWNPTYGGGGASPGADLYQWFDRVYISGRYAETRRYTHVHCGSFAAVHVLVSVPSVGYTSRYARSRSALHPPSTAHDTVTDRSGRPSRPSSPNGIAASLSGLRIAQIIESDGPGGAERVVAHLCKALSGRGASVVAYLPRGADGWLGQQLLGTAVEIEQFDRRQALTPRFARWLTHSLRARRISLVHSHEFTFAVHGAWSAWRLGAAHVTTIHGGRYWAGRLRRRVLFRLASQLGGEIAVVSEVLREHLAADLWLPRERFHYIPNGVPSTAAHQAEVRRELGMEDDDRLALAVGNLYPVKGHRVLIEALARLSAAFPRLHVAIAGRGGEEAALREQAERLGVSSRLHLLGLRQDVPNLLATADLFVMPSLSEGLPMAMLEAVFSRVPVVASAVGAVPEVLCHGAGGLLAPPADVEAIASAMADVLVNREAACARADVAREAALSRYSLDAMLERYLTVYERALRRVRRPSAGAASRSIRAGRDGDR